MPKLHVILASVRQGRVGKSVADWFVHATGGDARFDIRLVDLADYPLPFDDEPHHPRLGEYVSEHTRNWSEVIGQADAFVIVTPEYNYSFPASLKNTLDHLSAEWAMKPVAFVSYGGISGGLRACSSSRRWSER